MRRRTRRRSGDALVAAGARPAGLAARDTLRTRGLPAALRQRAHARARSDRGRARVVLLARRPASSAPRPCARCASRVRRSASRRSGSTAPASRAPATPSIGGGEVTSGTLSPCLEVGHRTRVRAHGARGELGTRLEIDVRGQLRPALVCERAVRRGNGAEEREHGVDGEGRATRRTSSTTPSTTGRVSRATRRRSASPGTRRTSSARSCSSSRPRSAERSRRARRYAEVESVKAVADVLRAALGRDRRRQRGARPRTRCRSTRTPTARAGS